MAADDRTLVVHCTGHNSKKLQVFALHESSTAISDAQLSKANYGPSHSQR